MANTRLGRQELDNSDPSYLGLMNSMKERFKEISNQPSPRCSIYRVPRLVRQLKEDAYTPRLVSIGPFHYGHENLKAMEVHKTRYTHSLFQRIQGGTPNQDLLYFECARSVLSTEEIARHCYSGHDHDPTILGLKQEKLAEILLVDGCFILEVLLRSKNPHNYSTDPIFGNGWMINCLKRDLVLLENQIPFFVLECLFKILVGHIPNCEDLSLQQLCVSFHLSLNSNAQATKNNNNGVRHLLDIVRDYYLPSDPKTKPKTNLTLHSIHCATKLVKCGIKFVKGSTEQLFKIKFNSSDGVLEIPILFIQDATESLLRNMIAFEQCCGTSQLITSYVMLMDRLIDTPQDVELLEQKRIIANHLGSGEDVSQLFNNMFKEVVMEDFYFEALCEDVNIYYNRRWPRYKAFLARNHCSNPWTIISCFAAFVLLALAAVQTGYTSASYYPH